MKKHWLLILLLLLLCYALWTANRILAVAVAVGLTLLSVVTKTTWLFAAFAWLLSLLWGSSLMKSLYATVYTKITGRAPPAVSGLGLG